MSKDVSEQLPAPLAAGWSLLAFVDGDTFVLDTPFNQILHGTFMRSRDTYAATCLLLSEGLPVQAAMLVRSLFEDMVVAHWLVLNHDDPDWLIERFQRHRDAIALHQERLQRETGWGMGRPIADPAALRSRKNTLGKEFGGGAQLDWWDPRSNGDGTGKPLGLRGIAKRLERSAESGGSFSIRFAGGQEPLLVRMELVVQKWMSQFLHHTALGLPFTLTARGEPELLSDPTEMVMFVAFWMFGQQIYLLHDVHGRDHREFNELFRSGLIEGFGHLGASPDLIVTLPDEDCGSSRRSARLGDE